MTAFTPHLIFLIASGILGAVIWFVRLEGRVNLIERLLQQHVLSMETTLKGLSRKLDLMDDKLDRVMLNCVAHYARAPRLMGTPVDADRETSGSD